MRRLVASLLLACVTVPFSAFTEDIPVYKDPEPGVFFRRWLICGPFPNPLRPPATVYTHDESCIGYYTDYLESVGGEVGVRPAAGMTVTLSDGTTRTWNLYESPRDLIDLNAILEPSDAVVAYAACVIDSSRERDALLAVGSNDGIKIWQNGRVILDNHIPSAAYPDRDLVPITLRKGENLFLLKNDEGTGDWGFMVTLAELPQTRQKVIANFERYLNLTIKQKDDKLTVTFGDPYKFSVIQQKFPVAVSILNSDGAEVMSEKGTLGTPVAMDTTALADGPHSIAAQVMGPDNVPHVRHGFFYKGDLDSLVRAAIERVERTSAAAPRSAAARAYNTVRAYALAELNGYLSEHSGTPFQKFRMTDVLNKTMDEIAELARAKTTADGLFPNPKHVTMKHGVDPFVLRHGVVVVSEPAAAFRAGIGMLVDLVEERHTVRLRTRTARTVEPGEPVILVQTLREAFENDDGAARAKPETYMIDVTPERIWIVGLDDAGTFYGLQTLRQLAEQSTRIPAVTIRDCPTMPTRAAYCGASSLTDDLKEFFLSLADQKYNRVFIATSQYLHLDDRESRQNVEEIFEFCRRHFLNPAPLIQTFGHGGAVIAIDPDTAEGIWVRDEAHVVEDGAIKLDKPRLVVTEMSRPVLASAPSTDNPVIYEENSDYKIASASPPEIQTPRLSRIRAGQTVYLTYDYIDREAHRYFSYCPSEPRVYAIVKPAIENAIRYLRPDAIHIGHDEIGLLNSDSRCRKRAMTNAELVAEEITKLYDYAKEVEPDVTLFMWADMLNPYHNALQYDLGKAANLLPKDIIMCDWWYGGQRPADADRLNSGIEFFTDLGFRTTGSPWYDPWNNVEWVHTAVKYMSREKCIGLLHTNWSGRSTGQPLVAQGAWEGSTFLD